MKRISPSVVRWPGGCFADSYNWRDGIGPRSSRPRRTNFWRDSRGRRAAESYAKLEAGPQKYEPNWFGTNEFMRFCKLTSSQPILRPTCAVCLPRISTNGWNTATLQPEPPRSQISEPHRRTRAFNVQFWGIGNESWGCGGNFTPEEYSQEYRRFVALFHASVLSSSSFQRPQWRGHRLDPAFLH
jgi:alpha-N-arabinofuranosidase